MTSTNNLKMALPVNSYNNSAYIIDLIKITLKKTSLKNTALINMFLILYKTGINIFHKNAVFYKTH